MLSKTLCLLFVSVAAVNTAQAEGKPVAGKQVEMQLATGDQTIGFQIYLPKDYDAKKDKVPLMLFLHGRGESYGPLSLVKKWGPPRWVELGQDFPFIIVSPQCPRKDAWRSEKQQALLVKLLDHIVKTYRVDEDRVYLTGLSMGGYGSWRLAASHPGRFAAVAPVCGGGNPDNADALKGLPIWVFHGDKDRAVPYSRSVEMVEAIKKAGGKSIRFTTLENIGHNCWSATYATPELYSWLLSHKRKK